ncbi:gamma carbonic anhydrase family protein [Microbaculum marinum]|uniref:Gamma carbonic anhydrase family protein n=1 Tax=Microbaculum marinum TaxID=1764581 RepID=A0AAW9RHE7_9HYPH
MMGKSIFSLGDEEPIIHPDAWVAPTAAVIGKVWIGAGSSVWFNCVLRGDTNTIRIGERSNIQDGTIVHVDPGEMRTVVGDDVTVGHGCILHGCTLEDGAFVGMGATVLNGCVVEGGGMLAAGALLSPGKRIRRHELWAGVPARPMRALSEEEASGHLEDAASYSRKATWFDRDLGAMRSRSPLATAD